MSEPEPSSTMKSPLQAAGHSPSVAREISWIDFLNRERTSTRETVFRLAATAAAVPSAVLAVIAVKDFRDMFGSMGWWMVLTLVVWAECLLVGAAYTWYQYAGVAKSLLRGHVFPDEYYPERTTVEFRHLMLRDPASSFS